MARERRDNKGRLLLTGEAQIRNGSYTFRYTDENGVRKSITNWKLLPEDQRPKGIQIRNVCVTWRTGLPTGAQKQCLRKRKRSMRFGKNIFL